MSVLLIDVDDFIITGNGKEEIQAICKDLSIRFEMNELGEIEHFIWRWTMGPRASSCTERSM